METKLTTLCYLERGGEYLMLHRTKKENDGNHDKWIGVGGKFEPGRVRRTASAARCARKRDSRSRAGASAAL